VTDVRDRAITAVAATSAARLAAAVAVEHHGDFPGPYRASIAAELVGLYGWVLAAEADAWAAYTSSLTVPTGVRSPGGGGVPDGTGPPRPAASGVARGPEGGFAPAFRAAPPLQPSDR